MRSSFDRTMDFDDREIEPVADTHQHFAQELVDARSLAAYEVGNPVVFVVMKVGDASLDRRPVRKSHRPERIAWLYRNVRKGRTQPGRD
jgi:hypothetical protein